MTGYTFYPTADSQLDAIWCYTDETWGEKQADAYIRGLYKHIEKLCSKQEVWRSLPFTSTAISQKIYCSCYKKHILFFIVLSSGGIGIISILHERMDLLQRLQEDLVKMSI